MDNSRMDELLRESAPAAASAHDNVRLEVSRMVAVSRSGTAGRSRAWKRGALVAIPIVAAAPFALVATGSTDVRAAPDFSIPVSYVTESGQTVACDIDLFNGELFYQETNFVAVDYFSQQDWTGVGQRIYDRAIALESLGVDGPWQAAEHEVVFANAPEELFYDGGMGSSSTCTGEL